MNKSSPHNPQPSVHGLLPEELKTLCVDLGQPAYRAGQVWEWLYRQRVKDWDAMTNVPAALRTQLAEQLAISSIHPIESTPTDTPGRPVKFLVGLDDGESVECVLIPMSDRNTSRATVCISSQAGCRFACTFCASGKSGFSRNLTAGEMVEQTLLAVRSSNVPLTHVVFMGVGEPLDNYDNVIKAIRILNDPDGLAIGARRITISTCGIAPEIRRLAGEGIQFELSVSLHSPDNALRSRLMPVNDRYPIEDVLDACADYTAGTGRIVTFEYTLIHGINDSSEHAVQLAEILRAIGKCRVNLIPLSPVPEFEGTSSPAETTKTFLNVLSSRHINVTLRHSKGPSINAACGQLRRHVNAESTPR